MSTKPTVIKEVMLWCYQGTSDKEYYMRVQKSASVDDTYCLYVKYGKRGRIGNEYKHSEGPLNKIEKTVEGIIKAKQAKGYQFSDKMLDML